MVEKQIINLTKYTINYYKGGEVILTIPSSGTIILNETKHTEFIALDNGHKIKVDNIDYSTRIMLPEENDDILYVVSGIVANVYSYRKDLLTIGDIVSDGKGKNIGISSFKRVNDGY